MQIIIENNKTWCIHVDGFITREHDDNFNGPRFVHKRCPFCNRITSIHTLHWYNHLEKCAPKEFGLYAIGKLRYHSIDEIDKHELIGR